MTKEAGEVWLYGPWSFAEAMVRFTEDPRTAMRIRLALAILSRPEDFLPSDVEKIDFDQLILAEERVFGLLSAGRLVASGYRLGSLEEQTTPGSWWARGRVTIDRRANTASAHGTIISGLLISRGKDAIDTGVADAGLSLRKGRPPRDPPQEKMNAELLRFVEEMSLSGSTPKLLQKQGIDICRCGLGFTNRGGKKAFKALPAEYKIPPPNAEMARRMKQVIEDVLRRRLAES